MVHGSLSVATGDGASNHCEHAPRVIYATSHSRQTCAAAEIIPALPANQWHLSEAGRSQCTLLADQLATYAAPAVLVSSAEPKALETAHLVAQRMHTSVQVVDGLQEHDRSNTPWLGPEEFGCAIAAFFRHPTELVLGCETAQQASERFAKTVAEVTS